MIMIIGTIVDKEIVTGTIVETAAAQAFAITSFTPGVLAVEVGQQLVAPAFTASYTFAPAIVTLTDDQGNPSDDVSVSPGTPTSTHTYQKFVKDELVAFTLSATTVTALADTEQASIVWRPRTYWGRDTPGQSGDAFIVALEFSAVTPLLSITMDMTGANSVGVGDSLYWAGPADAGVPTFLHLESGFTGGMAYVGDFVVSGESYSLYESDNVGIGSVTLVVS